MLGLTSGINRSIKYDVPSVSFNANRNAEDYGDITVSRSSPKWIFGSDGNMAEATSNTLPVEYDPATGEKLGWLIEGLGKNSLLDSRDMTTANWTLSDGLASIIRNQVGIDGKSNTACLMEDSATDVTESVEHNITIPADTNTHTASIFVKKGFTVSPAIDLVIGLSGSDIREMIILSDDGTAVEFGSDGTFEVQDWGAYWRVILTAANDGTYTNLKLRLFSAINSDGSSTPDTSVTGSNTFDQAQVELNASFPSSPMVSGSTTFTRSADNTTLTDTSWYDSETTIVVGFKAGEGSGTVFDLFSDANNRIYLERNSSNEVHLIITDGGVSQSDINLGTIADDTDGTVAVALKENDIAACLNGSTVATDSTATLPSASQMNIGRDYSDANYLNGHVSKIQPYPGRLPDIQLKKLSA